MHYYCDYNWIPTSFEPYCCQNIDKWENMRTSYYIATKRLICATSIDFTIRLVVDDNGLYIIEKYEEESWNNIFYSNDKYSAERNFIDLIDNQ
jgi:hypothetical protein